MIKMQSPSFCFNSGDVGTPLYDMWQTLDAPVGIEPSQVAASIWSANQAALGVFGKSLQNVVINCHGNKVGLLTGGIGKHGLHKAVLGAGFPIDGKTKKETLSGVGKSVVHIRHDATHWSY
jgi:hypothetical protein